MNHPRLRAALSASALLVTIGAITVLWLSSSTRLVGPAPGRLLPAGPGGRPALGFNDNFLLRTGRNLPRDLPAYVSLLRAAGATVVRMPLEWRYVQSAPGVPIALNEYVTIDHALRSAGITPLFTLMSAPPWAWKSATGCTVPYQLCRVPPGPAHLRQWGAFARQAAMQLPGAAFEIWNEPNYRGFYSPGPDPEGFVAVQREAYRQIKAINRTIPVLLGGLDDIQITDAQGMALPTFLDRFYAAGGMRYADAISLHPGPRGVGARSLLDWSFAEVRAVKQKYGDTKRRIWVTELSATTGPATAGSDHFTPRGQATALADAYKRIAAMPDVDAVLVSTLLDLGDPTLGGYAVVDRAADGRFVPKPAYGYLAQAAHGSAHP